MQKIYSLLRNNKQSGPYTLEELLQLKLKSFDLIWVEGKSAGWSYPTEIEVLKLHVSEKSKPVEKIETANTILPDAEPIPHDNTSIAPKPIYSQKNLKHIYISLPAGKQIISENTITKELVESFEESPEAKLERKALELRNKIQAFAEQKNAPKADNDLDTKYSRSLDDIKQEYSSWLYQQKKKKKFPTKYLAAAASVAILLAAAFFLFPLVSGLKQNDSTALVSQNLGTSLSQSTDSLQEKKPVTIKKRLAKPLKHSKKIKENTSATKPSGIYSNEEINKVDAYLDSLKSVSEKRNSKNDEIVYEPSSQNGSTRQSTNRTNTTEKQQSSPIENDSAPFTELIKLSESTGSEIPHLSLYNNSNKFIKFVAVDVYYYKANQKLLQKKTLYFNDIAPKSSARLNLPREKNAASVKYQMGLISTDNGLYYAKQ